MDFDVVDNLHSSFKIISTLDVFYYKGKAEKGRKTFKELDKFRTKNATLVNENLLSKPFLENNFKIYF